MSNGGPANPPGGPGTPNGPNGPPTPPPEPRGPGRPRKKGTRAPWVQVPDAKAWDRHPKETPEAFEAFKIYKEMPPTKRSIDAAYRFAMRSVIPPGAPAPSASGRWNIWASKHGWVSRAKAWDNEQERLRAQALEAERRKDAKIWATRREEHREGEFEISRLLAEKAKKMAEWPLQRTYILEGDDAMPYLADASREHNRQLAPGAVVVVVEPAKWTFQTLGDLIEIQSKLARLSLNMPQEIEGAPPETFRDLFFKSSGKMEAALDDGMVPPIPVNAAAKPDIDDPGGGLDGPPPIQPPRPPRPPQDWHPPGDL